MGYVKMMPMLSAIKKCTVQVKSSTTFRAALLDGDDGRWQRDAGGRYGQGHQRPRVHGQGLGEHGEALRHGLEDGADADVGKTAAT